MELRRATGSGGALAAGSGRGEVSAALCLLAGLASSLAVACARADREPPAPSTPPARWREPVTGMEFVYLPPGAFRQGTEFDQVLRQADEVPHDVSLSRGFYLGRYEVTQQEWRRVMGTSPSHFADCGPRCPVESVSYDDAREFIRRLSAASPPGGFRLPTEAEWEYACRAGRQTAFSTGDDLTAAEANYAGHFPLPGKPKGRFVGRTTPVGSYPPNPWGLFDLHGNVWEWCDDWYGAFGAAPATDPRGPDRAHAAPVWDARGGTWRFKKVIRGGSWYFDAESSRCALRHTHSPADSGFSLGLRLVRDVPR